MEFDLDNLQYPNSAGEFRVRIGSKVAALNQLEHSHNISVGPAIN